MKVESSIAPVAPYDLTIIDGDAEITFYNNVKLIEASESITKKWSWNEYELRVKYRIDLVDTIEANLPAWLEVAKAKEYETAAAQVRAKRGILLNDTDWTQYTDSPLEENEKIKWATYRQALRDLPQQPGFPEDIKWPAKA